MSDFLRALKGRSQGYRVGLILALILAGLRLTLHGAYLMVLLYPDRSPIGMMAPPWVDTQDGSGLPVDLQIYVDAARRLQNHQGLYEDADVIEVYQYPPAYAAAFLPFLSLSPLGIVIVHTVLHIAAYGYLFIAWYRIFEGLDLGQAGDALITTLPVWLLFTAFWSDLSYLNIYLIVALLSTLLIETVIYERLGASVLWLSVILHIKPHWAFAVAVPLLLGRYRFFMKAMALSALAYVAVVGGMMAMLGPVYVGQQYVDYVRFLGRLSQEFPWRGPNAPFLGYNHSIKQLVVYLLGVGPGALQLANVIKLILLAPLGWIGIRQLIHPVKRAGYAVPRLSLNLAFALYLGAFLWMDMVWEVSLGIAIFPYLLAEMKSIAVQFLIWVVFLAYALIDIWRAISFALWGGEIIAPGAYITTDPSVYVPLVLGVILLFYFILIGRLWASRTFVSQENGHAATEKVTA